MRNHSRTPLRQTRVDQNLDRAVQRVYERYGSNLSSFFEEAKNQNSENPSSSETRSEEPGQERHEGPASDRTR